MTASSDGDIRVLQPTRKPTLLNLLKVHIKKNIMLTCNKPIQGNVLKLACFQNPDCGEVAQISYNEKNQILAAGFSNNTVKTWAPAL